TQERLRVVDGHPINARASFVPFNTLPRSFEVLSVAHLLHQLFCESRGFGGCFRHEWFGLLVPARRGFAPVLRFQGQLVLVVLPLSIHEIPVLLASLNRSGLQPSFPAPPICFSTFRSWSASIALPTV